MSRGICRMRHKLTVAYFKDTELKKCSGESTCRLIFKHSGHFNFEIPIYRSLLHIYVLKTSAKSLYAKFNVNTTVNSMGSHSVHIL